MAGRRLAGTITAVMCAGLIGSLVLPYFWLAPSTVAAYYGAGPVDPVLAGLLGLCCAIVVMAASTDRTDPSLAAGVCLSLMVFALAITASWMLALEQELLLSFQVDPLFQYHPLVVVATAVLGTVSVLWYSHSLQLL